MPHVVQFNGPRDVSLVEYDAEPLALGQVRVATWWSGISAGTELTAYRGSNPYLTGTWDPDARLFRPGEPTFSYPVRGWGYSETGQVVEIADNVRNVKVGDVVHGIWGHRSEAVILASSVVERILDPEGEPRRGTFARVGAIALNAVLAAEVRLGDRLAIFGQGVIGLLATRLATLSGAQVVAVDALAPRLEWARVFGAVEVVDAGHPDGAGAAVRMLTGGVDAAIELSGVDSALHEAIRCVVEDGTVVASGFYQGGADHLRLGEEFHHNRVRILASQIGGTPTSLGRRWDQARLVRVFMEQVEAGRVDVGALVTDEVDAADVAEAFARLDAGDPETLQVLLRFEAAPR